jgi:hypothetical protein
MGRVAVAYVQTGKRLKAAAQVQACSQHPVAGQRPKERAVLLAHFATGRRNHSRSGALWGNGRARPGSIGSLRLFEM